MKRWTRTRDLALPAGGSGSEIWSLHDGERQLVSFPMRVRLGKPFDVLKMKGHSTAHFHSSITPLRAAIEKLYASGTPRRLMTSCPCCGWDTINATAFARIQGVDYRCCLNCRHVFIREQPTAEALMRMFIENDAYAGDYTSKEQIEQRLTEIVQPKLDWVLSEYRAHFGGELSSIVDVGAGGGHFVACCRKSGIAAEGYEINNAACSFAKTTLGVELRREDVLTATIENGAVGAVTCWGVLEYTPEPAQFVSAARRALSKDDGLLIVEVPRADAFGSVVQAQFPNSVWRHLSPASHMNIYSDASIATLLYENGFRPISAWYFGMDFYELLCQVAVALDDDRILDELSSLVAPMQASLDAAEFVDDLIIAAVPI
jgi:SAM-dependent methyltransferase